MKLRWQQVKTRTQRHMGDPHTGVWCHWQCQWQWQLLTNGEGKIHCPVTAGTTSGVWFHWQWQLQWQCITNGEGKTHRPVTAGITYQCLMSLTVTVTVTATTHHKWWRKDPSSSDSGVFTYFWLRVHTGCQTASCTLWGFLSVENRHSTVSRGHVRCC